VRFHWAGIFAYEMLDSPVKAVRKKLKKSLPKFLYLINPWGNHTQPGKGVDALAAVPLQTTLHTQIPSTSLTTP
jgi:hypothetical protein